MGAKTDHGPLLERGAGVAQRSAVGFPALVRQDLGSFTAATSLKRRRGTIAQSAVIEPAVRPRFYRYTCHSALS